MDQKKTASGYEIKVEAFLAIDMNHTEIVAAVPQKLKALNEAIRTLGFSDCNVVTKYRHRRAIDQAPAGDPQQAGA